MYDFSSDLYFKTQIKVKGQQRQYTDTADKFFAVDHEYLAQKWYLVASKSALIPVDFNLRAA